MNRRTFLSLTAAGLLVPEWVLDPPKGRSMVSVPAISPILDKTGAWLAIEYADGSATLWIKNNSDRTIFIRDIAIRSNGGTA